MYTVYLKGECFVVRNVSMCRIRKLHHTIKKLNNYNKVYSISLSAAPKRARCNS